MVINFIMYIVTIQCNNKVKGDCEKITIIIEMIIQFVLFIVIICYFAALSKEIIDINEDQIKYYVDNNCSGAFLNSLF